MSKIIRYVVFIAVAAMVWSCESSEQEPKESTNFSFDRIEYERRYGTQMDESVEIDHPMTIYNNSSVEQTYVFNPRNNMNDRVTFSVGYGFDQAFEFVGKGQKVKIPTRISSDGTFQYDDGAKWLYSNKSQYLKPELDSEPIIIPIPPNHALTMTPSFKRVSFVADYKLYLKGDEYGEELVVEGGFGGMFVVDYDLTHFTFPIE